MARHRRPCRRLPRPAGALGGGFLPAIPALQPHRPGGGADPSRAGVCHRHPAACPLFRQAPLGLPHLPHHQRHRGDHEPLCAGDRALGAKSGALVRHPHLHGAAGSAPDAGVRHPAAGGGGRDVALPAPERARGAGDPQPALRHQQPAQRVPAGDAGHSGHGAGAPLRQCLCRGEPAALAGQDQEPQDQRHTAAPPHRSLLHDGAHRPAGAVCPRGVEHGRRHPGGGALRLHQLSGAHDRAPHRDDQPAQPVAAGHGGGGASLCPAGRIPGEHARGEPCVAGAGQLRAGELLLRWPAAGAAGGELCHPSRPDAGAGGPHRQRQVHHHQPADGLLSAGSGLHPFR
ncbi:hypothetical protein D3C72_1124180 [compost metagenome]